MTQPPPDQSLTYEQARDELVALVSRLESGGAPLDESLALWERGEQLAAICQHWLEDARARIDAARAVTDAGSATDPAS
jgi:exodeoxyribonuclease VII small subunit